MIVLIVPLLFMGYFSAILSEIVVNKKQFQENLIALRDYDFVGDDKRLASLLAERMAGLQAPVNLTGIEQPVQWEQKLAKYKPHKAAPDVLELNLRQFPRVNVSLDYGEIFNTSDELSINASLLLHPPGKGPRNYTQHPSQTNGTAGRRAYEFWDPSYWEYNTKILEIMRHIIYSVQMKLIDIEPVVQMYQQDERFRIAYIFNRIDEWKKNIRTIYYNMKRERYYHLRFKRHIYNYEHVLRKNIDITYSIEFLVHLHSEYMRKMEDIMPRHRREELHEMKKKQAAMKKMQQAGSLTGPGGLPKMPPIG